MSSYRPRHNKLAGVKGFVSFMAIALIIVSMVYLIYLSQVKRQESRIVTDPIVLTNPGSTINYEIDEETMEQIDDETGLKSIFDKLVGKGKDE